MIMKQSQKNQSGQKIDQNGEQETYGQWLNLSSLT